MRRWPAIAALVVVAPGNPRFMLPHVDLTAAYAWLGRDAEAKTALANLAKLAPNLTPQGYVSLATFYSVNPVFTEQIARMAEGLRKAGLPEGDKKTN